MPILRNISEYPQTARWGEPAGSFAEVQPGETVEVPEGFVQDLLDEHTESGDDIWEIGDGEPTTEGPTGEQPPEAPVSTGSEGAAETGSEPREEAAAEEVDGPGRDKEVGLAEETPEGEPEAPAPLIPGGDDDLPLEETPEEPATPPVEPAN